MSDYSDIINLPHHVSLTHPQMRREDRAAQFAPFAALTGYEELIKETARLTNERKILGEDEKAVIEAALRYLNEHILEKPHIKVTYFKPDEKKEGGAYLEYEGNLRRIDTYERTLVFTSNKKIRLDDVYAIDGDWEQ